MNAQSSKDKKNNAICGIRKSSTAPFSQTEDTFPNSDLAHGSNERLQKRSVRLYEEHNERQSKYTTTCLTLCSRLRKRHSKTGHASQDQQPQSKSEISGGIDQQPQVKEVDKKATNNKPVELTPDKRPSSRLNIFKPTVSMNNRISSAGESTKKSKSNLPGDHPEVNSVTSELSTPISRNTMETNDADYSVDSQSGLLASLKKSKTLQEVEMDSSNADIMHSDRKCLKSAVERCERRLERLYGRLIWLRNSENLANCLSTPADRTPETVQLKLFPDAETQENHFDMALMQEQMKNLSLRVHDLKCQIETFSFLSWMGLMREPQTNQMFIPGSRAPPANPKLYLTRRPDSDSRDTAREYRGLCEHPISDHVRMDLRRVTFNNWPWSDAWLIRFVRQMFVDLDFVEEFSLPIKRLDTWLCDIYRRYNRVPFHNYKHAFMVTQMCYALMWSAQLVESLTKEDQLTLLVSAICHDLDHPGFNNAYQINAGTELAMRYNDQSPLENHHCATAFDILTHSEANPFEHFDQATMRRIRDGIITCILATDMSRHNEIVNQFTSVVLSDLEMACQIEAETKQPYWAIDKSKRDLVMMILIKVCDISNEARPLTVAGPWIDRLLAEFFHQSDYEKLVGLPVAPFMDREKVTKSASQCGFIRFVILPLFESLAKLLPPIKTLLVQPAIEQLNHYTEMQAIDEQQKIKKSQENVDLSNPEDEGHQ